MNTYGLATIVKNEEITAGIWKMELAASEIAYTAEPGQFIMLYPPDKRNLLARPISLSAISEKSVTIVYRIQEKVQSSFHSCRRMTAFVLWDHWEMDLHYQIRQQKALLLEVAWEFHHF